MIIKGNEGRENKDKANAFIQPILDYELKYSYTGNQQVLVSISYLQVTFKFKGLYHYGFLNPIAISNFE